MINFFLLVSELNEQLSISSTYAFNDCPGVLRFPSPSQKVNFPARNYLSIPHLNTFWVCVRGRSICIPLLLISLLECLWMTPPLFLFQLEHFPFIFHSFGRWKFHRGIECWLFLFFLVFVCVWCKSDDEGEILNERPRDFSSLSVCKSKTECEVLWHNGLWW